MIQASKRAPFLLLAVAAGSLLPMQFSINSALAGELQSVTLTAGLSYLVGALALGLVLALLRVRPNWTAAGAAPRWVWLGGVVGSAYVVGSVVLTRLLGAALATTLVIAAQVLTALALDHFGALGLPRRTMNRTRTLAALLVLAALGLRLWGLR
ncbi:DMT family transporter [Deinococcus arenicola]|uniref:DMT family transporter n=1 Tax=Deinococcus arenicola TaxID=2994950 RepID=A0ABU4DS13_9DEIO|nr:DMT family transporter [Deinococcus sp. ZS9-10]MDV6375222.1 DMT family transporter [Deinococcus sp. ZS9-10]